MAAYPAVIIIRRAQQGRAIVASAGAGPARCLMARPRRCGHRPGPRRPGPVPGSRRRRSIAGSAGRPVAVPGTAPAELLQRLEERFGPLEDKMTGTKIGIGVATGADRVFITKDPGVAEPDRIVPLAMTADTRQGDLQWSGHYLVDPWKAGGGLVNLAPIPGSAPTCRNARTNSRAAMSPSACPGTGTAPSTGSITT